MGFKESLIYENRHPELLVTALAKIGGLLALVSFLGLILREYHKRLFEKSYSKEKRLSHFLEETETLYHRRDFKDLFTFENLKESIEN